MASAFRRPLWLVSATVVLGLSAVFVIETRSRYAATIADAERVTQGFADVLAGQSARTFEAAELALRVAASIRADSLAGLVGEKAANDALQSLQKSSPALLAIGWTNAKGDVVAHSYAGPAVRSNIADLSHFIAQRDGNAEGLFIAPLYRSKASSRWISAVSLRLNNVDGSFAGVVTAPLDLSFFTRTYEAVSLGSNDSVNLLHRDGTVLVREPFAENAVGQSFAGTSLFKDHLKRSDFGVFEGTSPIDARRRIYAYRVVPGQPLIMVITQDRSQAMEAWYGHVLVFGSMVGLLIVIVILGAMVLSQRTEQLIRESTLLEATLANMHQGLVVVDRDDRIAIYNKRAVELLGLPESLLASRPSSKQIIAYQTGRGEFADVPPEIMPRLLPRATGEIENEYIRERPNGTVLEVRTVPFSNGGVIRTYKDVTAWKRIERDLSESERQFRLLAENATDVIVRLSIEGRLLYVSPSCHSIVGYTVEELLHGTVTEHIFPDDAARATRHFDQIVKGERPDNPRVEYRFRHKAGHWIWLESNPRLTFDGSGRPMEFVDVVRNVTDRKMMEAETALARQQAEDAAVAQAQFLATMSHELRTPLNSIVGFSDVILDRIDLAEDVRRQVGLMQTASETLLTVVNDVLDFSKIEEGKLEVAQVAFDLRALIDAVIAIARGPADSKNLDLHVSVDERIAPWLLGDDQRLRQVLFNLVNNGIKFTRSGYVSLAVELMGKDETGESIRFSISDTGIGISEEKLDRLFLRFSQVDSSTSREYGGSGLGLAISKRLVEAMGGQIGVESSYGSGSTFWIQLSLSTSEFTPEPLVASAAELVGSSRLLLVEDVAVNREIACAILRSHGYHVDAVADGFDAIAAVQSAKYDLVLMDIQMPGVDGMEATRQIRALRGGVARIPIVALTANVLPEQVETFRAAGMNGHVGKPFRRNELHAEIERCLSHVASNSGSVVSNATATAAVDEQAFGMLLDLMGPEKIDVLLNGFGAQLEQFASYDPQQCEIADLVSLAHGLTSSAGMLGFRAVSNCCARFELCVRDVAPARDMTFDQVREVCLAALREISTRRSSQEDQSGKTRASRSGQDATSV